VAEPKKRKEKGDSEKKEERASRQPNSITTNNTIVPRHICILLFSFTPQSV
jgi:hypothetical protein